MKIQWLVMEIDQIANSLDHIWTFIKKSKDGDLSESYEIVFRFEIVNQRMEKIAFFIPGRDSFQIWALVWLISPPICDQIGL